MSGVANSTAKLLLSAANLLLGERSDVTGDHDAKQMLRGARLRCPGTRSAGSPEIVNPARLLTAAARFARVFELAAPDAPGLVSFGAPFDPVVADPLHAGSPMFGVSAGSVLRSAFLSDHNSRPQSAPRLPRMCQLEPADSVIATNAASVVTPRSTRRTVPI